MDLKERQQQRCRHPWEQARALFFQGVVRRHAAHAAQVVDVGAGDGWFAAELQRTTLPHATIICWDTNYTDDDLAVPLHDGITRRVSPPATAADLVLALDVVEHVADDRTFVGSTVHSVVSSRGVLIVSVPAHQWLFGRHDVALGHHRRYSLRQLTDVLSEHFDIVERGTLFTTLLAPRAAGVLLERRSTTAHEAVPESVWRHGPVLSALVTAVLRTDIAINRLFTRIGIRLPGLSVWAVCRPRSTAA